MIQKYKNWSTMVGCILIHFTLGSVTTFGNFIYIVSYLREYQHFTDVRAGDSIKVLTTWTLMLCGGIVAIGLIKMKFNIKLIYFLIVGSILLK
jgi:hypothetical protein